LEKRTPDAGRDLVEHDPLAPRHQQPGFAGIEAHDQALAGKRAGERVARGFLLVLARLVGAAGRDERAKRRDERDPRAIRQGGERNHAWLGRDRREDSMRKSNFCVSNPRC
jgi:hypothetical protein